MKLEIYEASFEKQSEVAKAIQISGCAANKTCNSLFVNMKQAEMHFLQLHRQPTHGYSKQSFAQSKYSPVTFRVCDTSIREEETNQIEIQSRTNTVNPSICPRNKASKPSVNPIIGDVPNVICSKVKPDE